MIPEHTIEQPRTQSYIEAMLLSAGYSLLHMEPVADYHIERGSITFPVYTAFMSLKNDDGEQTVGDFWVVLGGGLLFTYNRTSYKRIEDAVAQHVGMLVLNGAYNVVVAQDGTDDGPSEAADGDV